MEGSGVDNVGPFEGPTGMISGAKAKTICPYAGHKGLINASGTKLASSLKEMRLTVLIASLKAPKPPHKAPLGSALRKRLAPIKEAVGVPRSPVTLIRLQIPCGEIDLPSLARPTEAYLGLASIVSASPRKLILAPYALTSCMGSP